MAESKIVPIEKLELWKDNPRGITKQDYARLKRQIQKLGVYKPLVVCQEDGKFIVLGGNMRLHALRELDHKQVWVSIVEPKSEQEKVEISLSDNDRAGYYEEQALAELVYEFRNGLDMADFKVDLDVPKTDLNEIIESVAIDVPETFDLAKEIKKVGNMKLKTRPGDLYQLGDHRLLCGDSTSQADMERLMGGEKADFCFTDPPYDISYLKGGKRHGSAVTGFGAKQNRRYLTTEEAPKFGDWMPLVHRVAKRHFNIIVFENWKNVVPLWEEMAKYWTIKNMIIWHLTNRCQGYTGKHFFNKYDIAILGSTEKKMKFNKRNEGEELENEYEVALYAMGGKAYFDARAMKGRYFTSDHIEFKASNAKSAGQSIIFGTKPVEILIPYIKILSKKGDIILEPFTGSGSTMMAAEKLKRRCYMMEKTPLYCDVIIARYEKFTGKKAELIKEERNGK